MSGLPLPPLITFDGSQHRLECIVLSVGCAKMLRACLSNNMRHVDHMIVGTTPDDLDTQAVCKEYGATCFVTDAFHRNGAKFDKGWAHNEALKTLRYREFVLFIDVDIVLHTRFRTFISSQRLNTDVLYGADRIYVTKDVHVKLMTQERLCGPLDGNDWGFGFFQLFHMQSRWLAGKEVLCRSFPSEKEPFGSDDFLFREQFGTGHVFFEGVWNWDLSAQARLILPCFHIGPPGHLSKGTGLTQRNDEPWSTIPGPFCWDILYAAAVKSAPENAMLIEVGTGRGRGAVYLLDQMQKEGKPLSLYCVDEWYDGQSLFTEAKRNLDGSTGRRWISELIRGNLVTAAKRFDPHTAHFVFIHTSRETLDVRSALPAWWSRVASGGSMAGDHWQDETARAEVSAFAATNGIGEVKVHQNCWFMEKPRAEGLAIPLPVTD